MNKKEIDNLLVKHAELLEETQSVVANLNIKDSKHKDISDNALKYYTNRMRDCMDYLEFIRSNIKE